jgi:peptidoglycan/xylan/chitin deacetylase (PgdA/CDA1 family)
VLICGAALLAGVTSAVAAEAVHLVRNRGYASSGPICRVDTSRKIVALSFDDGPDSAYTDSVLTVLRKYGDLATFFVIGSRARAFPRLVRHELDAGMEIGDHTWSHSHLPALSDSAASGQIVMTERALESQGAEVRLLRAPFGEITPTQLKMVSALGLQTIGWSMAIDHYVGGMGLSSAAAAVAMSDAIRPGDIVLAHDAALGEERKEAFWALQLLLPMLKARGFQVTTVSRLLGQGRPILARPRPWFWQTGFECPNA